MTEYWVYWTDEEEIKLKHAIEFFNNRKSQAFRILIQTTGWSVNILKNEIGYLQKLKEQNRALSNKIQGYLGSGQQ
jgi:hypothetical protein